MTSAFVDALKAEIGQLDRALRSDIRYARLKEAERLLALYIGGSQERPMHGYVPPPIVSPTIVSDVASFTYTARRTSPERAKALEEAQAYVRSRRGPVPTSDIYARLQSRGIPIGGKEPVNTLSAMLSNSTVFQSNGRAGWTLQRPPALAGQINDPYDYDGPWGDAGGLSDNDATNSDRDEPPVDEDKDPNA